MIVGITEKKGPPEKLSCITPLEEIKLPWSKPAFMLFAFYEDIFGNELLSVTNDHETKIVIDEDQKETLRKKYKAVRDLYYWKADSKSGWESKMRFPEQEDDIFKNP